MNTISRTASRTISARRRSTLGPPMSISVCVRRLRPVVDKFAEESERRREDSLARRGPRGSRVWTIARFLALLRYDFPFSRSAVAAAAAAKLVVIQV